MSPRVALRRLQFWSASSACTDWRGTASTSRTRPRTRCASGHHPHVVDAATFAPAPGVMLRLLVVPSPVSGACDPPSCRLCRFGCAESPGSCWGNQLLEVRVMAALGKYGDELPWTRSTNNCRGEAGPSYQSRLDQADPRPSRLDHVGSLLRPKSIAGSRRGAHRGGRPAPRQVWGRTDLHRLAPSGGDGRPIARRASCRASHYPYAAPSRS